MQPLTHNHEKHTKTANLSHYLCFFEIIVTCYGNPGGMLLLRPLKQKPRVRSQAMQPNVYGLSCGWWCKQHAGGGLIILGHLSFTTVSVIAFSSFLSVFIHVSGSKSNESAVTNDKAIPRSMEALLTQTFFCASSNALNCRCLKSIPISLVVHSFSRSSNWSLSYAALLSSTDACLIPAIFTIVTVMVDCVSLVWHCSVCSATVSWSCTVQAGVVREDSRCSLDVRWVWRSSSTCLPPKQLIVVKHSSTTHVLTKKLFMISVDKFSRKQ